MFAEEANDVRKYGEGRRGSSPPCEKSSTVSSKL